MAESEDIRARLGAIEDPYELIRGLFQHAPTPYAVFDHAGHCLLVNPAYVKMFGQEPPAAYSLLKDEVAGALGLTELFHAAYAGQTVKTPTIWYNPNDLKHVEVHGAKKAAIACTLFPLRAGGAEVTHVAITYSDLTAELTAKSTAEAERDLVQAILQQSGDGIIVADKSGTIQIFNTEAERQHGVSRQHVNAPAWSRTFGLYTLDGEPLPLDKTPLYLALHGKRVENAEWLVRPANASARLLCGTATPLRDAEGEVTGAMLITRDETDRKAAEQHLRLMAAASAALATTLIYEETFARVAALMVPALADWCFVDAYDKDGTMVRLEVVHADKEDRNLAIDANLLPIREPSVGEAGTTLIPSVQPVDLRRLGLDPMTAGFWQKLAPHSYMRVPLLARGRILGTFTLVTKVSERTFTARDQAAAEELASRAALAADNARLYQESRQAAETAENANRAKDEFMAVLGHELRNPLAPIATALDIIRLRSPTPPDPEHKIIGRQVQHLRRLVDDLLDVSRISKGKVELRLETVPVVDVIQQAMELASPLLSQKRHSLHISPPDPALGFRVDPTRIVQVLVNLLTNAAKYTPPSGDIYIEALRLEDNVIIRIRDTGIGITPAMLDHVFELFVQAKQESDRAQGGLGLGLNIARSLVHLHRGKLGVSSGGLGKGSEFVVTLPGAVELEHLDVEPSEPMALQAPNTGRRIVVIDDNQDAADLLAELLREMGHAVQVAYDGPAGIAAVAEFQPSVALVDIGLPLMDGHQVATNLRSNAATRNLLLVALTGYGQDSDRRRSKAAGFDAHLVKPIDLASLARIIASPTADKATKT